MDTAQQLLDKYQPLVNNLKNMYPKTRSLGKWDGEHIHVWQSRIEIEYYSVAYFEHITEFDAL